jgi:hypothetical protein
VLNPLDYRAKAEHCSAEARGSRWTEIRDMWLQLQESYEHLADREERIASERLDPPGLL